MTRADEILRESQARVRSEFDWKLEFSRAVKVFFFFPLFVSRNPHADSNGGLARGSSRATRGKIADRYVATCPATVKYFVLMMREAPVEFARRMFRAIYPRHRINEMQRCIDIYRVAPFASHVRTLQIRMYGKYIFTCDIIQLQFLR